MFAMYLSIEPFGMISVRVKKYHKLFTIFGQPFVPAALDGGCGKQI